MSSAMSPRAAQKRFGESKNAGWKFIPSTPAMRVEGRITTEAIVRTFMTSFVRCPVRDIKMSNEPRSISRVSSIVAMTSAT